MSPSPDRLSDETTPLAYFKQRLKEFNAARGWGKHFKLASLAISISLESAELLEKFQWSDGATTQEYAEELSDIVLYCLLFSMETGIDLSTAIDEKMKKSAEKYPEEIFKPDVDTLDDYWAIKKKYRAGKG